MEVRVLRMALLISCWFIIGSILIPDGFLKWFYLSFYNHPLLLFLCQIFLWVKLLQGWLLLILCLPIRLTCFVASSIFRVFSSFISLFPFIRQADDEESEVYELRTREFEEETDYKGGSLLEDASIEEPNVNIYEDLSSPNQDSNTTSACSSSIWFSNSETEDVEMNEYFSPVCRSNSPVIERGSVDESCREEDFDSFYQKYTEKMRWFDLLNHDRTCGISAILKKQLASSFSFESINPVEFSIPYISWSKMARRRLLRRLESDFELVYVAQSCLSWEALHYQYRKVEALACSGSQNGAFFDNVAGRFQKFQILLERFMEDEICEGKRYWNYVQRRVSLKSLLQVPHVSGYMEEGDTGTKGEAMRATEVLEGIEKCIKAFWSYVKTEKKKPQWKMKSFSWIYPPVEDPRDLKLLADLTKTLQKKELWLKDLQGKKRCWLKRVVNPLEESQKKEILFTMIDMKLVSRALKMSMISTSQLKWCQEKLHNIEFKEGKVVRASTCSLFPSF